MFATTQRAILRVAAALLTGAVLFPTASAHAEESGTFVCPVMGAPIASADKAAGFVDYKGSRLFYCCAGCQTPLEKDPAKFLTKNAKEKKGVIGAFLFDPVTTERIAADKATAHSDYNGIRYFFSTEKGKAAFDKQPKKYTAVPKQELLFCPVSKEAVASYEKASDYSDYRGERIYFCCDGCKEPFDKNPMKYAANIAAFKKSQADVKAGGN
jgi:YHS domain-containing protein